MREISDRNGKDCGNKRHRKKDNGDNGEHHDRLALTTCEGRLIAGEAGLEGIGVLLFEVEEMR